MNFCRPGFLTVLSALTIWGAIASAQTTTAPVTTRPDAAAVESDSMARAPGVPLNPEPQAAPRPAQAPPGKVLPTAAGGKGGATSVTEEMPLDQESLTAMRKRLSGKPEFRGAWITRFDWAGRARDGQASPTAIRQRIVRLMDDAAELNLNAVLFQVRGDATTLYPSKLEPWSQLLGGKNPGFDPVAFAIDEAHKRGLEFHAYINPVPCSEERTSEPASMDHAWHKHCTPDAEPNWLVFQDGKPAPFNEYLWFNPNLPDVQTYIREVVIDFVKRYDVDGVHFDRIRFPSHRVSDDPWSKARFEGGANPGGLDYNPWQAENITRMLTDIYGAIMEIKPKVKVSAAVWGIYDNTKLPQGNDRASGYSWTSSGLQNYMQDSIGWANRGCMDALVPMIYWNMGDLKPDYDELLQTFVKGITNERHVYGGQRVFDGPEMLRQTIATTLIGAQGTVPFTLGRISRDDLREFYQGRINPTTATVPSMPWKNNPKTGAVLATVVDTKGKPVVDAHVTITGEKGIALSSADGFCAVLNLKPGKVIVSAAKGKGGKTTATAQVSAGKAARVTLKLAD